MRARSRSAVTPEAGILAGAIQFIPNLFQFGGMIGVPLDQEFRVGDQVHDALQKTRDGQWG
jgi:hypothetical protein